MLRDSTCTKSKINWEYKLRGKNDISIIEKNGEVFKNIVADTVNFLIIYKYYMSLA